MTSTTLESTTNNMGVEKKVLKDGNGTDKPKAGDTVTMEYTGWLYDASASDNGFKGKK